MSQCAAQPSDPVFLLSISFRGAQKRVTEAAGGDPALLRGGRGGTFASPEPHATATYLNPAVISALRSASFVGRKPIAIVFAPDWIL